MTRLRLPALALAVLLALPFVAYALGFGWRGLTRDLSGESYLFRPATGAAPPLLALHMIAGALLTLLVPLQLIPSLRRRAPALHRLIGRTAIALGLITALGGLAYITERGTIGGAWMSTAFTLYGVLLASCALQAFRFARARDLTRHRAWALRFFALAMGSFLYRLHYGLWEIATGGLATAPDFSGAFDRINLFAFYLPYLALTELYLSRRPAPA